MKYIIQITDTETNEIWYDDFEVLEKPSWAGNEMRSCWKQKVKDVINLIFDSKEQADKYCKEETELGKMYEITHNEPMTYIYQPVLIEGVL